MDENCTVDNSTRLGDEDIIQLLNIKKQKSREILSITNAAADAVSNRTQKQTKQAFIEQYSSQNYAENKENTTGTHISDSFMSTGSNMDGSFNGQQRVRIASRLLREIKSPLDRSSSGNVSSSESRNTSSGSLFASQSSSEHSSIQATGPVPTVIKYSSQPSQQPQHHAFLTQDKTKQLNDTPVVIKYLQEYTSPNSKNSSTNTGESSKTDPDNNSTAMPVSISQKSPKTPPKRHIQNEPKENVFESENVSAESLQARQGQSTGKPFKTKGPGLCQGAPSNNLAHVAESERGQVKAVSFSLSGKGKATRDMLTKRQENCPALRRVVQPKLVEQQPVRGDQRLSQPEDNSSNEPRATQDKCPSSLEEQMKDLMSTLGTIESQCQENRVWQEKQRQELEQSIKQRDERRLQHLEEMQERLVEYQLRYAQPITAPPQNTYASTLGNTTHGLSTTQVIPAAPTRQTIHRPAAQASSGQVTNQNLTQGMPTSNPNYAPAVQHKTQPSFKTTVYNKPRDENSRSGVKRKFVRNTRTQTSPQSSSSLSSPGTSSPLDTPLPRKRHPVPMTRDWKADLGKKHVHFDTPDDKNTGKKYSKSRVDAYPGVRSLEVKDHKLNELQNLQPSHRYGRSSALVSPRSPESDYIVNDIGRLRQELRDALNETEQTKLSLKNLDDRIHSQISSDESVVDLPDHTRPYPLDAYLRATRDVPGELSNPRGEETSQTDPKREASEQESGLCSYALSVLRDVQKQKENLEWNLQALSRRHDEQYLYTLAEEDETNSDALRIRQDVAKKIEEIDAVVQAELLHEEQQRALENQVSMERSKPTKQPRSTHGVPLSTEKRAKLRNVGKENTQTRAKTAAKPKVTKPPMKQAAMKRPLEDATYVSRVFGRPDNVTRRTTVKADQNRYQSSGVAKPNRSASVARRKTLSSPRRLDESSSTVSEDYRPSIRHATTRTPRYYFQPNVGADQSVIDAHFRENQGPLPGQLLPMAIPLGKPRMDPALRLPLCIDQDEPRLPQTVTVSSDDVKRPNVAVITLKDEECIHDFDSVKKHKKSTPKKKERVTLEKQILPNVDIDTSAFSEVSSDVSTKEKRIDEPTILPIPDPLPRPDASEYEEFKDYEHVRTVGDDEDSEKSSIHGDESAISLHGESRADKPAYQGPAFPPRNIPMDAQDHDGFQGTLGDLRTPSETVEHKARELIEQELLARVVSEMAPPLPDPTSRMRRTQSSESFASSSDAEPDLAGAIGLRGLQLFVDAGIPVDTELVQNLIMEVLQEKVVTMLGYPKPQENIPPATQQEPEDDYTEPESGSEDYSRIQTPVRTPSAASPPELRPLSHVSTPEQTQSSDTISSSGHVITDKDSEIEEGLLDNSDQRSPIATPVATPSPPQSVISLPTPDVSEREQAESDQKSPVDTPEITVSIRDKTPTESPEDLEDDLKEQTLVEDNSDEQEDEKTGADIPVIKFELEPEPSEAKVTNSPSSITTTTYSTHSTMGTVATDDEISEGEQLQPYVHVGQYSEGEYIAPSGITGAENMTTLREIPDDIFDSFDTSNKKPDLVKQAFQGLLQLDEVSDESTRASEENTSSEGQQRFPSLGSLAQSGAREECSEGEVVEAGDAVSILLSRMRQSVWRRRPPVAGDMQDTASVGEIEEKATQSFLQRLPRSTRDEESLSPGEFASPHRDEVNIEPLPMQTLERPSVLDSDENNNDSQQSSSINEVPNQTWDTNIIMVTPRKATVPFNQQQPNPSNSEHSPPANPELSTTFPRVVHVAEAGHVSTPLGFSSSPERVSGSNDNVTVETFSEIETNVGHGSDHVSDEMSDHVIAKHVPDQRARIQLTLPSVEPSASVSLMSEGILGSDDSAGEISSISGGEV